MGRQDLILCGEWMPITIFSNEPNGFVNKTAQYFPHEEKGFWRTVTLTDVNSNGKPDIIAGNVGLNSPIRATEKEPAELYFADFDGNGSIDPFFNFYVGGKGYPFVSRDELNEQIYPMRKQFTSYKAYADATMPDIFPPEVLAKAGQLSATETRSVCFIYTDGTFIKKPLPVAAQFSAISRILPGDYNHDGKTDLLLFGNQSDNRLKIGSIDANYGCLLAGDGKGNFDYIRQPQSGLSVVGDVKSAVKIKVGKAKYIVLGASNQALQFYRQP